MLTSLVEIALDENATPIQLLKIIGCLAVFWAVYIELGAALLRPLLRGRKWMIARSEKQYDEGGKEEHEAMGVPKTREEFVKNYSDEWVWNMVMFSQHIVGGALSVPSLLRSGAQSLTSSLACLGIMSEIGFEVGHIVTMTWTKFFTAHGNKTVPIIVYVLTLFHHSLSSILGLPMILNYRSSRALHWLNFDLQFSGALAGYVGEYTRYLDVSKPIQLLQMQVLNFILLVTLIWTRGLHWVYLCTTLAFGWYKEERWMFFVVGIPIFSFFSIFNFYFCIQRMYTRFIKFMKLSAAYKGLPPNADAATRRASLIQLRRATNIQVDLHKDLISVLFEERKVSRRQTMPARSGKSKLLASFPLMAASTGGDLSNLHAELRSHAEPGSRRHSIK